MERAERFSDLKKEQKHAIGLLSIGTFLEYFDLMLYVHMGVILNDLFFPKADEHRSALFSAMAFSSTYLLRPFGAMLFGWIGDNIGRKHTVIITTFMMSIACIVMATVDTYANIGYTATWIVMICRMIQGLSSIGELTGAQLYVSEITRPPVQYPAVAVMLLSAITGSVVALAVAAISARGFNWRIAFWIGAAIALIGSYSRSTLRETPEFADAKRRFKRILEGANKQENVNNGINFGGSRVSKKTALALFAIDSTIPIFFYLTYVHLGQFLKNTFGYNASDVISHNLKVGIFYLICCIIQTYLSYRIHPLKILRVRTAIFCVFILFYPYLFSSIKTPFHLLMFQILLISSAPSNFPAVAVFFKYFPVFKRFTYTSILHAISHTLVYIITSFGFVYLIKYFGQLGVLVLVLPISIAFIFGLRHFEKLEQDNVSSLAPQKTLDPIAEPAAS